ncbi:Dolichol phosphate-mannose biosynthesis regulatory protein [Blomia tropicalis]|nr:Dolichol phosphate-mannose biosynthesis regulatory protein [Blomia tropicalis]
MVIEFAGYDRPIGIVILSVTTIFIIYYSLWIILVPLLNEDHIIPSLFPRISIGLLLGIPVAIGTTFFLFIVIFSIIQMRSYKPKIN